MNALHEELQPRACLMEELQRLAAVQSTLLLLHTHSLHSENASSDHFLAKLLISLVHACKDAEELAVNCRFLTDRLQQISISPTFVQDLFATNKQGVSNQNKWLIDVTDIKEGETCHPSKDPKIISDEIPWITLGAMERAKSTLEDFCRSYFMFHGMDSHSPRDIFKHLPLLAFVESYIYQIDEQNEQRLLPPKYATLQQMEGVLPGKTRSKTSTVVREDCFKPLRAALAGVNVLTQRIEKELQDGREYWTLEHSLCSSISAKKQILISDVMRAIKLKSFDYRVLNLLLYELSNEPVNETHMEFLSVSEFLVEISDDLFDYEEDVLNNSFNILRMFVRLYGQDKAPCVLAKLIGEAEEEYNVLLEKLEPMLASHYQKRCEEAVIEGGRFLKHSMGSWTIPPIIVDEDMYRRQLGA